MKADRCGTSSEQQRARLGWLSPSERLAAGIEQRCIGCGHSLLSPLKNVRVLRCHHALVGVVSTVRTATCPHWTAEPGRGEQQ